MVLVVGATGLVGSEVCRLLAKQRIPVRALVRSTSAMEKVEDLRAHGVELCAGDLKHPASLAEACKGVDAIVSETPPRLDYLDALSAQLDASALLALGSSEPHYTASRLFPSLMAARPLLALYHEASSVTAILRRAARPPSVRLIAFSERRPVAAHGPAIHDALAQLIEGPRYDAAQVDAAALAEFSAPSLAGRLASLLDRVCEGGRP